MFYTVSWTTITLTWAPVSYELLGNIEQPWTVVEHKGNSQLLLSSIEFRHQPRPGLREFRPGQRVVGQTCSWKVPRSQYRPSLITSPKLKIPARSDPVKRWNFRKADWKRICLLTDESVEKLPPPDTSHIERAYQDFCLSLLSAVKQCIPRGCRKNYVPC